MPGAISSDLAGQYQLQSGSGAMLVLWPLRKAFPCVVTFIVWKKRNEQPMNNLHIAKDTSGMTLTDNTTIFPPSHFRPGGTKKPMSIQDELMTVWDELRKESKQLECSIVPTRQSRFIDDARTNVFRVENYSRHER
jgi:hypothetical protein